MKKEILINLIKECIQEVMQEKQLNTADPFDVANIQNELQEAHKCNCGSGLDSEWKLDARGIPLAKVCPKCEKDKLKGFRRDVLLDPNYKAGEPIELDDIEETECGCADDCQCKQDASAKKIAESDELGMRLKIQRALKKFSNAEEAVVTKYINAHKKSGATIKQLEDDAKSGNWNDDTTKAIYYLMRKK